MTSLLLHRLISPLCAALCSLIVQETVSHNHVSFWKWCLECFTKLTLKAIVTIDPIYVGQPETPAKSAILTKHHKQGYYK